MNSKNKLNTKGAHLVNCNLPSNTSSMGLMKFNFRGDDLDVIKESGRVWISVRRVCDALGLHEHGQREKLKNKPWACTQMICAHDVTGRNQKLFFIDLDSLPMWLATIDTNRVSSEIKEKLVSYQKEAATVLRDYFFGGIAVNTRLVEQELLSHRQKTAVELLLMARDVLDPTFVRRSISHSIAVVQGVETPEGPRLIDVSSFLEGKGLDANTIRKKASQFGKILRVLYEDKHGRPPGKLYRLVNGSERLLVIQKKTCLYLSKRIWQCFKMFRFNLK